MRLSIRLAIVLGSMVILVLALNLGVAFAHEPHDSGGGTAKNDDSAPVGSNILPPDQSINPGGAGGLNGFLNPNSNALDAIANNPLCPAHPE